MRNELVFIFKKEDIQKLLDKSPDFIVVKSSIVKATLDTGKQAGVVQVRAEAISKGNTKPLYSVDGCPMPPCTIDDKR